MTKRRRARAAKAAKPEARLVHEVDARLVHELEIYKVELHLQNEELRATRAAAEAALERYREVFDFAPIGYAALESNDTITEINRAGAELLGLAQERLIGKRFGAFIAPQSMGMFRAILAAVGAEPGPGRGEVDLWRSGVALPVRVHASTLPRSRGTTILAFEDISARKEKELALARSEHALREEGRRKDDFLAMLSHELRNPLAPIRTSVAVLEMLGMPVEDARAAVDIIGRSSAHLAHIVDDLLDITRIRRGKIELRREIVDINHLVRKVIEEHGATLAESGLTIDLRLANEELLVDGDPVRLVQILSNLLANAEKFTQAGGRVMVVTESVQQGRAAGVHVRDTGIGIAPEVLGSLGLPFVQAPQTIERSRGGLGLGLAMARSLSELHGGTVAISSEGLGRGTEVIVSIPLIEGKCTRKTRTVRDPAAARRVLLIEDNVDGAQSLARMLGLRGHSVDVVHVGRDGIARAVENPPDLVLCDLGLPDLDGYEVARQLRRNPALATTSLIALSGYALPEDVARALSFGFDAHVAKPANLDTLERLLQTPPRR